MRLIMRLEKFLKTQFTNLNMRAFDDFGGIRNDPGHIFDGNFN